MATITTRERRATKTLPYTVPLYVDKEVPSFAAFDRASREIDSLIAFCRRNLDGNAWLPKAVQRRLFDALVAERSAHANERVAHSRTRDQLGADVVRVRRLGLEHLSTIASQALEIRGLRRMIRIRTVGNKSVGKKGLR